VIRAFESFLDDLSNWYIRCSRRRFWEGDETALRVLWHATVQSLRVIGPVLPLLSEHLWQVLVREPCSDAPDSVHLAGWPVAPGADAAALDAMADARRIVDLGRVARSTSGVKLRQPLGRLVVEGVATADELVAIVREELRVKDVSLGHVEADLVVKPNLPVLGPKLGKDLGAVRTALAAGEFEDLGDGRFRAAGHELSPEEVLVERSARDGWAIASADGVTVALDTAVDEGLEREARVYELIHQVNTMRKEAGLALTDRIALTIPSRDADLLEHADWIKAETLATSLEVEGDTVSLTRA
jgi:isoleucyl-tRNA synthetase